MPHLLTILAFIFCAIVVMRFSGEEQSDPETPTLAEIMAGEDDLYQVTSMPVLMEPEVATACAPFQTIPVNPHKNSYAHVFITQSGWPIMEQGTGEYPEGTTIVKQKYSDAKGTKTELFTVMRKREAGYDAEHGDWEYSIIDHTGHNTQEQGRLEHCIECHQAFAETDYVTRKYLK